MPGAADAPAAPGLPASWPRLESAVEEASAALPAWRRRALEAEEELARLRTTLEALASERDEPRGGEDELRRLRAENAALRSRMAQARRRVQVLLTHLGSMGANS